MSHSHLALLENQAFSLMGRMHVILRRQSGRTIDIEYMRIDPGYCRHVLGLALQQDNADLRQICGKLQEIYFGPGGLFTAAQPGPPAAGAAAPEPAQSIEPAAADHAASANKAYIGRLR